MKPHICKIDGVWRLFTGCRQFLLASGFTPVIAWSNYDAMWKADQDRQTAAMNRLAALTGRV